MKILIATFGILILFGCGLDCIDKKTGMPKASETMKRSKEQGVYQFELDVNKLTLFLDSGLIVKIKNVWVENKWRYECVSNDAVLEKEEDRQLVIDASYNKEALLFDYWLRKEDHSGGNGLGARLDYNYADQDTFILFLEKDDIIVDTLKFFKKNAK